MEKAAKNIEEKNMNTLLSRLDYALEEINEEMSKEESLSPAVKKLIKTVTACKYSEKTKYKKIAAAIFNLTMETQIEFLERIKYVEGKEEIKKDEMGRACSTNGGKEE